MAKHGTLTTANRTIIVTAADITDPLGMHQQLRSFFFGGTFGSGTPNVILSVKPANDSTTAAEYFTPVGWTDLTAKAMVNVVGHYDGFKVTLTGGDGTTSIPVHSM